MFEIECNNCRETNQLHDRMKGKTVRCHICQDVIQVGEVKKELIRNINRIDDHENRIRDLEYETPIVYVGGHIGMIGMLELSTKAWEKETRAIEKNTEALIKQQQVEKRTKNV